MTTLPSFILLDEGEPVLRAMEAGSPQATAKRIQAEIADGKHPEVRRIILVHAYQVQTIQEQPADA